MPPIFGLKLLETLGDVLSGLHRNGRFIQNDRSRTVESTTFHGTGPLA